MTLDDILKRLHESGYESRERLEEDLKSVFKKQTYEELLYVLNIAIIDADHKIQQEIGQIDPIDLAHKVGIRNGFECMIATLQEREPKFMHHEAPKKEPLH